MPDSNALLQQLQQVDQAYENAKKANSPDAEQLGQMARQIAQQIYASPIQKPDVVPQTTNGNTQGSAHSPLEKAVGAYGNMVAAPLEAGAQIASGAVAAPIAGLAGAGVDAAHALGLTNRDATDTINSIQNAMTYQPRTPGGQDTSQTVQQIAGAVPKAADAAGQWVSDKTGSPALGTLANTGIQGAGMILGGEVPAMARAAGRGAMAIPGVRPAVNLVGDLLPGGTERSAGRNFRTAAGSATDQDAAAKAIDTYQRAKASLDPNGLIAKYQPTTAQVAGNAGLAGLDRTLRNQAPDTGLPTAFADRDALNRKNTNDILEGISGTADERLRAQTARDLHAKDLYDKAVTNAATQHPLPTGEGMPPTGSEMPVPDGTDLGLNAYGTKLNELMQRPALQQALAKARELSANSGVKLTDQNAIQTLHWVKQALDDKIAASRESGLGPTEQRILLGAKNDLLDVMDGISPEYALARNTFKEDSGPINRMDVGEYLRQRYMSALADAGGVGTRPSMFTDALRNDSTPSRATGFGGATWDNTLAPGDMQNLQGVAEQLGRENFAQNAGRGIGSNTGQNLAGARAINNIGSVHGISEDMGHPGMIAAMMSHPGVAVPLAVLGSGVRRGAISRMGEAALDPQLALKYLRPEHTVPLPPELTLPASAGANENARQSMADGGQPDPYKKSSFWDLVKQGWKELQAPPVQTPQVPAQPPSGQQASGPVGADFDRRIDQAVADQGG